MNKLKQKKGNNSPVGPWFWVLLYVCDCGGGCGVRMGEAEVAGQKVRMEPISSGLSLQQLEVGLWFLARDPVRLQLWEHQILATRLVVSDKNLALQICRKFLQRRKVVKQIKHLWKGKKSTVHVDRHMDRLKESHSLMVTWITYMGHFFWVSVDLSGSEFIFGVSQDPPICVHASLSQGGFYQRSLWVLVSLSITPLFTSKGSSYTYVVREVISLLEWEIMRSVFFYLCRA